MSRPRGPPPYTTSDIAKLTTPTQKFVAQAELNSYIAGHELADKRDKGLLMPYRNSWKPNGAPHPDNTTGSGGDLGASHDGIPSGSDVNCDLAARTFGPIRTNNRRDGARSRGTGRGSGAFHPYRQPQQARTRFVKRAAAFANNAPMLESAQSSGRPIKSLTFCPAFTSTGKCTRFRCPDTHDTGKQALCKLYLYKDECTKGDLCHLSHQPSPHNAPHCLYYRSGRCTNSPCLFAHVNVDNAAPVCEAFGRLGYCEEGAQCANLHVYECPDFSNMGSCAAGDRCSLRHVHHASRMKAAARRSSGIPSPPNNSDLSQVEHITGDTNPPSELHAISQQHDYVAFDLEDRVI